jgi:hypothetical protein
MSIHITLIPSLGFALLVKHVSRETTRRTRFVSQSCIHPFRSTFDLVVPCAYSFHIQPWTSNADSPVGRVSSRGKGSIVFMLINK